MTAILGIVAFVLALFAIGAFMEGNTRKLGVFVASFLVCAVVLWTFDDRSSVSTFADCRIDWDGRSNPEVCD